MRPDYNAGSLLRARDLNDEQADRLQHLKRHNRFAHGSGIVCGLAVIAAPRPKAPWTIRVCPGYAVGPCGDEIEVPSAVLIDIRQFFWSRPYVNGLGARAAFVSLRPSDDTPSCGCHTCGDTSPERVADGYILDIVWAAKLPRPVLIDLCQGGPIPCPPVPSGPELIIAAVRLPASEHTALTQADVFLLG